MNNDRTGETGLTGFRKEERQKGMTLKTAQALGGMDEHAGDKIKDISDKVCIVVVIFSIIIGFLVWNRNDGLYGALIGILIMCFGMFSAYVLSSVLSSYGDIIANTVEQTKILQRMEAEKLKDMQREQEEAKKRQAAEALRAEETAAEEDAAFDAAAFNAADAVSDIRTEAAREETKPDAASPASRQPILGVVDARLRRVAHFKERSRRGIICPICGRLQDSKRDKCSSCDSTFVFDNESGGGDGGRL